jgi:hypothetical protein
MTPKEKAFSLYFEYARDITCDIDKAKKAAMICVSNILKIQYPEKAFVYTDELTKEIHYTLYHSYWADVLIEINKIK